jgi:hypothetical protein
MNTVLFKAFVRKCDTECTAQQSVKMNSIAPAQMQLLIQTSTGQQAQIFWKSYKQTEEQLRCAATSLYTFTLHCVNSIVLQFFLHDFVGVVCAIQVQ